MIEEDMRFTLFIAGDVFGAPRGEFLKLFPIRHGGVLQDDGAHGNLEGVEPDICGRSARVARILAPRRPPLRLSSHSRGIIRLLALASWKI